MKRTVIIPALGALLLGACGLVVYVSGERRTPGVFHGNVDIREVNLGFRVPGRVAEVLKDQGDGVTAGETLARLDDEPYRHALERAASEVALAAARLTELRNGARAEDVARAEASLSACRAALKNAEALLARLRELRETRAVSAQDLDNAQSAYDAELARRDVAAAELALLKAGTRPEQLAQAEAALASAKAVEADARMRLEDTRMVAAEPGVVLTRAVEPGTIVAAGATALSLSLQKPVWVRAYADEPELGAVRPGRPVLVFTDSRREPYHGRIGDVSPRAEFTPKTVETEALRTSLVYRFRVVVTDPDDGLRRGMPVTVRLQGD